MRISSTSFSLACAALLVAFVVPAVAQSTRGEWAIAYCPGSPPDKFDCTRATTSRPDRGDFVKALYWRKSPRVAIEIPGTAPGLILGVGPHPVHKHITLVKYEHDEAGTSTLVVSTYMALFDSKKRQLLGAYPFHYRVSGDGAGARAGVNMGTRIDSDATRGFTQPAWKHDARHIIVVDTNFAEEPIKVPVN